MKRSDYEKLRARIVARYEDDLAALQRIWVLFRGDDEPPAGAESPPRSPVAGRGRRARLSEEEKAARKKAYMKAWRERQKPKGRRGRRNGSDEKGIPSSEFSKFLVAGPVGAGGNGD